MPLTPEQFTVYMFPFERGDKSFSAEPYVEVARLLEQAGFRAVALPHLAEPAPSTRGVVGLDVARDERLVVWEPMMLAPILAYETTRLRIGWHSANLSMFHPYHWARFFANLDRISGGRVDAGVCLGGVLQVANALGCPDLMARRGRAAEEAIAVMTKLWSGDPVTFDGEVYSIIDTAIDPTPLQTPRPPLWWGGGIGGAKRAVASGCDYILPFAVAPAGIRDELMPKIDALTPAGADRIKVAPLVFTEIVTDSSVNLDRDVWPKYDRMLGPASAGVFDKGYADVGRGGWPYSLEQLAACHAIGSPAFVAERLLEYFAAGAEHCVLDFNCHGAEPPSKITEQVSTFLSEVLPLT